LQGDIKDEATEDHRFGRTRKGTCKSTDNQHLEVVEEELVARSLNFAHRASGAAARPWRNCV
jgi:hypothetical protein